MDQEQGLDNNANATRDSGQLNIKMNRRKALLMSTTGLMTLIGLAGEAKSFAQGAFVTMPALTESPY